MRVGTDLLIGDVFRNAARAVPDRLAAVVGERSLTFAELDRGANRMARAVAALGVARGDRVVVWCGTHLEVMPLFVALAKLGAVFAPINNTLERGGSRAGGHLGRARAARGRRRARGRRARGRGGRRLRARDTRRRRRSGRGRRRLSRSRPRRARHPRRVLHQRQHRASPRASCSRTASTSCARTRACCPSRGARPCARTRCSTWARGRSRSSSGRPATTSCSRPPTRSRSATRSRSHAATRMHAIPAIWRRVLDHLDSPEGARRDLSSVRFADTGTSATPIELLEAIEAAVPNATLRVFYGSTEGGPVAALEHDDVHRKPGSVGMPAPFAEVRLSPEGEICVRGPHLFDGYFGNPAATAEVMVDGWYRMGDLADVDDEGTCRSWAGRATSSAPAASRSLPARSRPCSPTTLRSPTSRSSGMPDPQWGEVICAVLVLADGQAGADRRRAAGALRQQARQLQAPPSGRGGRRDPAHGLDRAGAPHAARRAAVDLILGGASAPLSRTLLYTCQNTDLAPGLGATWNVSCC